MNKVVIVHVNSFVKKRAGITLFSALLAIGLMAFLMPIVLNQVQQLKRQNVYSNKLVLGALIIDSFGHKIRSMPNRFKIGGLYVMEKDDSLVALDCSNFTCNDIQVAEYDFKQTLSNLKQLGIYNAILKVSCISCGSTLTIYTAELGGVDAQNTPYDIKNTLVWP